MNLSTLARRNVFQNKSVIFIVALASMLICVVINLAFSVQHAMIENILETVGDNHARYSNITQEQVDLISQSSEVELADLHLVLRDTGIPVSGMKNQIGLMFSSGLGYVAGFKLTSGSPPQTGNEAAIPPHVAELLDIKPEVGSEFDLIIKSFHGEETIIHFTVTGILQQQRMFAAMNAYPMFVSETLARQFENDLHLFVRFKDTAFIHTAAKELAEKAGGIPERDFALNEQYLSADLQDLSAFIFAAAVLLVICAAGAFTIFNAYNLSVVRRIHQYGLLSVIGASQKQIKGCVRVEALYCLVLGLPFGLIAGTFIGYWGMLILDSAMGIQLIYVISPVAYVLSVLVTLATVLVGISRPVLKASQIAPVEAARFSDAVENFNERNTIGCVTINALAKANMLRAKKRVTGTVMAFSMSGILLLGFSTVAFSMRESVDALAGQMVPGDISVSVGMGNNSHTHKLDPLSHELAETISCLDGVVSAVSVMGVWLLEIKEAHNSYGSVIGVEPDTLQKIINNAYEGNPSLADFNIPGNVIAVMSSSEQVNKYKKEIPTYHEYITNHKTGNMLNFHPYDHSGQMVEDEVSLNIVGLVYRDDVPDYFQRVSIYADFYTLSENITALGIDDTYKRLILTVDDEKHDSIYDAVRQLCADEPDIEVLSLIRVKAELTRQIRNLIIIIILMLSVIALAGIVNLIGATFMGVEQRKKELGILMAVGLSRKNVGKLLAIESRWVSLLCTAMSAVLGLGLGLGLYALVVRAGADYMRFVFPLWPLIAVCAVMWLVPYAVTLTAAHSLKRSTIVDLLGRLT